MKKFTLFALATFVLLSYALYQGMVAAPTEATMGEIQRIFYYHVPSAWTAFACFFANFAASIVFLLRRRPAIDAFAVSTAEVGLVFTTVVLVTGPIWARPVWGIWWTWDARLTSTLVLWLIYASYLLVRRYSTGGQGPVIGAALAVFGAVDVVFVYMAIRWFRTQHPQPVIGGGEGSGIDPRMMHALLWNFAAFVALAILLIWLRYRLERLRQQVEEAHAAKAMRPPRRKNLHAPASTMTSLLPAVWIFALFQAPVSPGDIGFLYAAYVATWVVHIVYAVILLRGYQRVREDVRELEQP